MAQGVRSDLRYVQVVPPDKTPQIVAYGAICDGRSSTGYKREIFFRVSDSMSQLLGFRPGLNGRGSPFLALTSGA